MDLSEAIAEGKKLSASEKSLAAFPVDARIALVLNNILRSVSPPEKKDTQKKTEALFFASSSSELSLCSSFLCRQISYCLGECRCK